MSIFQDLCQEADDNKRRAGILNEVPEGSRKKVADILCDSNTQCITKTDPQKGVMSIIYQNVLGKVILTPNGIERMNDSGTTWGLAKHETTTTEPHTSIK